ncbi:MAG TPA: hypothetical protein VFW29_08525 [Solirubrobacteraceae bacterium]|nr:hypothetical protein [Solirubrobacteraceae bacterium]
MSGRLASRPGRALALLALVAAVAALLPAALSGALVQQGTALTATGESGAGNLGTSLAVSADGSTAAVGARRDNGKAGAVFIFTRSGGVWSQQGEKLVPAKGQETGEGEFGWSVALSADGDTLLVGAPRDNAKTGGAWVFTRSGSTWSQQGKELTGAPEQKGTAEFGLSVALSGDGNTALVGGPEDNAFIGAAWAFTRASGSWAQLGTKLLGGAEETGAGEFGESVAVSSDATTALVGASGDSSSAGAGWAFARGAGGFAQQGGKLTGEGVSGNAEVGESAALSANGNVALLGGPHDNGQRGAVWAYARTGSTWTEGGPKLVPSDASGASRFGLSVALSASGDKALIGAPQDSSAAGAVWVFAPFGSGWSQLGLKTTLAEASAAHVGEAVTLSADGDTALVGAPEQNAGNGAAWPLVDPPPTPVTGTAIGIATTLATLNGSLPPGPSANAYFQWGTTAAYGNVTAIQPQGLRTGPAASALSGPLGRLTPGTTYHFRLVAENSGGTSVGADQTFTTLAVAPVCRASCCGAAKCPVKCVPNKTVRCPRALLQITNATQSHKRWRRGRRAASIARRAPVGTTFRFVLSKKARVRVVFSQAARGRRVHGRCVAPNHANRRHRSCRRSLVRGSVAFKAHAGVVRIAFQGIVAGGARLAPGNYVATISAAAGRETSNAVRLRFTIVR